MNYLFIANLCVWAGIGAYLCFIHVQIGGVLIRHKRFFRLS